MSPSRFAPTLLALTLPVVACHPPEGPGGFSDSANSLNASVSTSGAAGTSTTSTSGATHLTSATPTEGDPNTSTSSTGSTGTGSTGTGSTGTGSTGNPASTSGSTGALASTEGTTGGESSTSSSGSSGEAESSGEGSSSSTGGEPVCQATLPGDTPTPQLFNCPEVQEQSIWCLFLTNVAVMAVGLEDGIGCHEASLSAPLGTSPTASVAVLDANTLLVCDHQGGLQGALTKISLTDGAVEVLPLSCQAITHYQGHLLVYDTSFGVGVRAFASLEDLLNDKPQLTVVEDLPTTYNIAASEGLLFTAWQIDDHLGRRELPCGDDLGDLPLENYEGWIGGLAVTDDEVLVALKVIGQEELHTFHALTGAAISSVPLDYEGFVQPRGLVCYTGTPP